MTLFRLRAAIPAIAVALCALAALAADPAPALAPGAPAAPGATATAAPGTPPVTAPPAPIALRLVVANRSPLQLRGVTMRASTPDPTIVYYYFEYGDGIVERDAQPRASHGYAQPGTYHATVAAIDAAGRVGQSSSVTVHVRDGLPPTVAIAVPRPGARMRLGASGVTLSGTAQDPGGVRRVQLAIELVSSRKIRLAKLPGCVWYDPHRRAVPPAGLALTSCQAPVFFAATLAHRRWHYRIPGSAALSAGTYVVRVRAGDRAGNLSDAYSESLRTIIPFRLG